MALQNFEDLNVVKRRSIPYDIYFGEMDLTKDQRKRREDLALILEDYIAMWFIMVEQAYEKDMLEEAWARQQLTYMIYEAVDGKGYFASEAEQNKYISNLVSNTYQTTIENLDESYDEVVPKDEDKEPTSIDDVEPYWVSNDRAKFIAENESNTIINSAEFTEAINNGFNYKVWDVFPDDRVRPTHMDVFGEDIPIDDYFTVGEAIMLYPKDVTSAFSTGAEHPEEVINCRCTIRYIKR